MEKDKLIAIRRELHSNPEPSHAEHETARRIRGWLDEMGIENRIMAETGVVGLIKGGTGKRVALRADIDALSIKERTGLPYASKNEGFMHACGHDAHMTMLLGAASLLKEQADSGKLDGEVLLVFQCAEEYHLGDGARSMIEEGVLDGVSSILGMHVVPTLPAGIFALSGGAVMAEADHFFINLKGKSGHGAMPHETIDVIPAGAALVSALQTIVSRESDPQQSTVLTVATFNAGDRMNIIAGEADLSGTVRTYDTERSYEIENAIRRVLAGICAAYRVTGELNYTRATKPVVNDAALVETILSGLEEFSLVEQRPAPVSEDFCYFGDHVPAAFGFLGVGNPAIGADKPLHHPEFMLDEDALPIGAGILAAAANSMLK